MLSRTVRISIAHRAGAIAVTLAVLVLGFAPIRFVSANDDQAKADAEYKRAVEAERKAEQDRQREYDEVVKKSAKGTRKEDEIVRYKVAEKQYEKAADKVLYEKTAREAGKSWSYDRPETAYAIKIKGKDGTRGSVGMVDMGPLQEIDNNDETVVYFRFGDQMWISKDKETIERVMRALAPEDQFETTRWGTDMQREQMERSREVFENRSAELKARRQELEERRDALRVDLEKREASGAPDAQVRKEIAELDDVQQELGAQEAEMARERYEMAKQMRLLTVNDKMDAAKRDKVHQQVLTQIAEIGRRAIAEGNAVRYIP